MNIKQLVKISNIIALISIILLVYWVFIFIIAVVFGIKIFRENITEIFGFSILGILAILASSLIVNIMLNLTRIAQRNEDDKIIFKHGKLISVILLMIFPVLTGLLFYGDYLSSQRKKQYLLDSAQTIAQTYKEPLDELTKYKFDSEFIGQIAKTIQYLQNTSNGINYAMVIVPDTIDGKDAYLGFSDNYLNKQAAQDTKSLATGDMVGLTTTENQQQTTIYLQKIDFIYKADAAQKEYLDKVFSKNFTEPYFSASDGRYEMLYPYQIDGKVIAVLYFSDYQRYGKYGS
ncbi:MAG: peptidase [Moraxella sp.]|nr:MAG: peptidase [Moraxella sp.]